MSRGAESHVKREKQEEQVGQGCRRLWQVTLQVKESTGNEYMYEIN